MLQLPLSFPVGPLGQAENSWMTAWLTPIWFLAAGLAIGIVVLVCLVLLFKLLSTIPVWERLSHSSAGHAVAAGITAALTAGIWFSLPPELKGEAALQEPLMLGIALTLCCAIVGWALVFCPSRQAAKNAVSTLSEGVAGMLSITALTVVFVGAAIWGIGLGLGQPIVEQPIAAFESLPQIFTTGKITFTRTVPGSAAEGEPAYVPIDVPLDLELLRSIEITSDKQVLLGDAAETLKFNRVPIRVEADEPVSWNRTQRIEDLPIPYEVGTQLHIQNREIDDALITFVAVTQPPVPQAATLLIGAISIVLLGLVILLQQAVAPRVSAVSLATIKNELAQPLFLVLMIIGIVSISLYEYLSFNTFGEDIKLLKDCGITTIMLLAAFQGIWSASSSISEEIEGKTALTVLSKPIQRRSFIIGKFMGIFWVLMLMFVILGTFELVAVAYKPIYEAREMSTEAPNWQQCHLEMIATIPGLVMAFMQSIVLTAISVALATRLPQLANLSVCFAIYVLGNLTTSLVSSTQDGFEIVRFVAQLVATIIPILEHFSLQAAIDAESRITMSLLSGNLIYCLLYIMLAMFLALLLFEDRDLA